MSYIILCRHKLELQSAFNKPQSLFIKTQPSFNKPQIVTLEFVGMFGGITLLVLDLSEGKL